jgi:glycosyltransferase involved in cell wall biosynthesis
MKVLQVIDTLKIGGAERMTVLISNLLSTNGNDVTILILVEKGELITTLNDNIPVFYLNRKKRFSIKKLKQMANILDAFDIVHVHLKHNFRYASLVSKYFSKQRHKLIFHDHSHYYGVSKLSLRMFKDYLFKSVFKPDYYIGVNEDNCNWAKYKLKLPNENIHLLENTVKKEVVESKVVNRKGIVVVSNISRVKNIEFAIKLSHVLGKSLTIYGQIRDEAYFEELKHLIEKLKYAHKVKFEHHCNNIQSQLYKYEFAVHTSYKETGPLVLIEYLAQGLPFIAHATGQVYDILKDKLPQFFVSDFNLNSWLVKINNPNPISDELLEQTYNAYFSSDNYLKQCLKIYQSILNS